MHIVFIHNYEFMPIDINQCIYIPYYIFQYEYDSMIHFLLQNQGIDLNNKIVLNSNILRYFCSIINIIQIIFFLLTVEFLFLFINVDKI